MQGNTQTSAWTDKQVRDWFAQISQDQKRSYDRDVVSRLRAMPANVVTMEQYGSLSIDHEKYPLFRLLIGDVYNGKPNILITGGVHGYEPSGIDGAIEFAEKYAPSLSCKFNFVVYPCISPWAYEFDHRWNNLALDPNRLFSRSEGTVQIDECTQFMTSMETSGLRYACAVDLHETPDRDVELRQQRAQRFGTPLDPDYRVIPNGFYLILSELKNQDSQKLNMAFGQEIIRAVRGVSPIATHAKVLGKENQGGIITSAQSDGLLRTYLAGHADYVGVTEVYPDHPQMGPRNSIAAQMSAFLGAMRFLNNNVSRLRV